jgi:hypothetical protein
VASSGGARRWVAFEGFETVLRNRWLGVALAALLAMGLITAALEAALGLHPGFSVAIIVVVMVVFAWSTVGFRAALGEPQLVHWRRLLEEADVRGAVAGVDVDVRGHPAPALAEIAPDAHLHLIDPQARIALPLADASCDAVVLGPRVAALDEASRETLLDDAHRVLRVGGHLALVIPTQDPRDLFWMPDIEWQPGCPQSWWSDALGERFEESRWAPLNRRLDVVLATRTTTPESV